MLSKETERFLVGIGIRVRENASDVSSEAFQSEAAKYWATMPSEERMKWRARFNSEAVGSSFETVKDYALSMRGKV